MAKAVAFWEPMTARCAPPSRQDEVLGMCKSNAPSLAVYLSTVGGFAYVCRHIVELSRNEVCEYLCPDKYNSWNFRNAKVGGSGSIEFRRPPGVVEAKKAKHWIAFTMAFVEMVVQFNPAYFLHRPLPANEDESVERSYLHREEKAFDHYLLACAKRLGVYAQLDPRLGQPDNTQSLHITSLGKEAMELAATVRGLSVEYKQLSTPVSLPPHPQFIIYMLIFLVHRGNTAIYDIDLDHIRTEKQKAQKNNCRRVRRRGDWVLTKP